jgi:DNA polymerase elongation subunit (family B)
MPKWMSSDGYTKFWPQLAEQLGYKDAETLRSDFKNERKRRGIKKENKINKMVKRNDNLPNILVLDIETSPLVCFTWGIYDQRLSPENVMHDWYVFCYSAKWLFDETAYSGVLTSQEAIAKNDKQIVKQLWDLLDQADIVITYNGDHFDIKKLNTRFALYELPPPSFYRSVDLYKVAKENFGFTSNKLSFVNTFLDIDDKTHPDYDLWKRCWNGETEALHELKEYNINDVMITEMLYFKLLPWIKNHPNLNVYNDENIQVCPKCASKNIHWDDKFYYTQLQKYATFRCADCKSVGRSKKNLVPSEKSKNMIR